MTEVRRAEPGDMRGAYAVFRRSLAVYTQRFGVGASSGGRRALNAMGTSS